MKFYQQCFFITISMLLFLHPTVMAAPVELSLEDSITLALQNNHDIKYAQASREKYFWAVKQTEAGKGVSLDYTHTDKRYTTYSSYRVADNGSGMVYLTPDSNYVGINDYDNLLALNYSLYTGGSLEGQIDQAKLALKVADLDVEVAKQQLKFDVVNDYFTVLEYRNELQVEQETVHNYEEHLNLVNDKYSAGLVDKTQVLSSEVNLAKSQDSLIKAQNNYNNAVAALNNAMGMPHDTELVLKDNFTYGQSSLTLEQCLQYAREHRPEIAQYEAKVSSAQDDVKIAKSGHLPTVDLTAEQDWNDEHLPGLKNSNWLLKLTTSFNVFDSGITDSKIKQAQHSVQMAINTRDKERDSILLDVRNYYLSMCEAEKRIDTNKVSVKQAEESLNIQKVRYDVGIGTNIDLLDAVLDLDSAKKDYVQALYDYNTNKAGLERAMGRSVN